MPALFLSAFRAAVLAALLLCWSTFAYIPAVPVNDTSMLNLTDKSSILLRYAPNGVYGVEVSSQLMADVPTGGIDSGAIVHFTESGQGPNLTTSTPWIAFISCDRNETTASDFWDIFTLVRDRGAVAAVLYTLTAEACLLNQDYIQNFEKPVDVFATKQRASAEIIENQFKNTNDTFYSYNGTLLNSSGTVVNDSLAASYIPTRTFLLATLTVRNSTGDPISTPSSAATATATAAPTAKSKSLPMIVLYAVTGVIVGLFGGIIIMGAIRAIRHPERYGPRATENDGGRPAQTSVQGIGHAILDTFPVIKFARKPNPHQRAPMPYPTYDKEYEMDDVEQDVGRETSRTMLRNHETGEPELGYNTPARAGARRSGHMSDRESFHSAKEAITPSRSSVHSGSWPTTPTSSQNPEIAAAAKALAANRASVGARRKPVETDEDAEAETCPICLLEFETGDDVRVLPCQQAHSYHQACIDPWLLEVSPSCPLCRRDFSNPSAIPEASPAAESSSMGRHRAESDAARQDEHDAAGTRSGGRFGRYLAFVRRERRRAPAPPATSDDDESEAPGDRRRRRNEQLGPGPY